MLWFDFATDSAILVGSRCSGFARIKPQKAGVIDATAVAEAKETLR